METLEAVRGRVESALTILPKEIIWIDPDCGLKTRTVEQAIEKLRLCIEAAKSFR
jgi:5-methyltetrahydropteroyltriglutamate--homocysteine methyltransferase